MSYRLIMPDASVPGDPAEVTEAWAGKYVTILMDGTANLMRVAVAAVNLAGELELSLEPDEFSEPDPTPLEVDRDGQAYPQVEEA